MEQNFQQFLQQYHIVEEGVVLACSGGVDSMVLAYLLHKFHQGPLYLVHIHHGLRVSADKDLQCVTSFAQTYHIPLFTKHEQVDVRASEKRENIENMGRKIRYDFLKEIQEETKSAYCMTAHHADDQIESMLMHLIQGTSPAGMKGLGHGPIVRPLLSCNKAMIRAYAQKHNIAYCEDETNEDTTYFRNELRSRVLPIFYKRNPRVCEAFQRFADHEYHRELIITQALQEMFSLDVSFRGPFSYTAFMQKPLPLRQALVRELCVRYASLRPTQAAIENITQQVEHLRSGTTLPLGTYAIARDFDHVRVISLEEHEYKERATVHEHLVDRELAVEGLSWSTPLPHQTMYFSHNGQVFHKTFKKYCVEKKIPVQERRNMRALIYTKTNEIAALEGYPSLCVGSGNYIFIKEYDID